MVMGGRVVGTPPKNLFFPPKARFLLFFRGQSGFGFVRVPGRYVRWTFLLRQLVVLTLCVEAGNRGDDDWIGS